MFKSIFAALLLLIGLSAANATDYSDPYSEVIDGIVRINVITDEGEGSGTGFFFEQGHILTAAHLFDEVKDMSKMTLNVNGDESAKRFSVKVDYIDPLADIAILVMNYSDWLDMVKIEHAKILKVSHEPLKTGQQFFGVGNRLGYPFHLYRGNISRAEQFDYNQNPDKGPVTFADAEIFPGDSGGPIFNEANEVVGTCLLVYRYGTQYDSIEEFTSPKMLTKSINDYKRIGKPWRFNAIVDFYEDRNGDARIVYDFNNKITSKLGFIPNQDKNLRVIGGKPFRNNEDFLAFTNTLAYGDFVIFTWERDNQTMFKGIVFY